jgi:hypothetical protein
MLQSYLIRGLADKAPLLKQSLACGTPALLDALWQHRRSEPVKCFTIMPLEESCKGNNPTRWSWLMGAVAGFLVSQQPSLCLSNEQDKGSGIEFLSKQWKATQMFKYERRLRENSSSWKVFQYFSSFKDGENDQPLMTKFDVMRSLCAVHPDVKLEIESSNENDTSAVAHGMKLGKSIAEVGALQAIMLADGNDGFSFSEWILIETLLSYTIEDLWILFNMADVDGNGLIEREELGNLLLGLIESTCVVSDQKSLEATVRNVEQTILSSQSKKGIDLDSLKSFCQLLREDISRLHYRYYQGSQGTINGTHLAFSAISSTMDIRVIDTYLKKIESMPYNLRDAAFDYSDFKAVGDLMGRTMKNVIMAMQFYTKLHGSPVTFSVFQKVLKQIKCEDIRPKALAVLFYLFSEETDDGQRILDIDSLSKNFQNKSCMGYTQRQSLPDCIFNCLKNASRKR